MPTLTAAGARVLMQRVEDNVFRLGCPKKVFGRCRNIRVPNVFIVGAREGSRPDNKQKRNKREKAK
jgi:hypothetical protein